LVTISAILYFRVIKGSES